MITQEIGAAVDSLLAAAGIKYETAYQGVSPPSLGGNSSMDKWAITIANQQFEFFTGLGLRAEATTETRKQAAYSFPHLNKNDLSGITTYGRRYLAEIEKLRKLKPPTAASVLHSLLADSQASIMSFSTWCADFGYTEDSRKAFGVYQTWQANGDKLNKVMGGEL